MAERADVARLTIEIGADTRADADRACTDIVTRAYAGGLMGVTVSPEPAATPPARVPATVPAPVSATLAVARPRSGPKRTISLASSVTVTLLDTEERIRAFLPEVHEVVGDAPMRIETAEGVVPISRQPAES